ncbi:MAG: transposase family protein [Deltaproteobacteria bacterium]|nr:transposase family protein [Deltaproteobacteria bacterium]
MVHWEIREAMKEADVERLVERARELHPGVSPRIISDNGPQFIAGDFKQYIRLTGMTHVRTSPYSIQSNGKIERWQKTIRADAIRQKDTRHPRRGRSCCRHLRRTLQPQTPPLRHRLRHPRRPPRRTPQGH